MNCPLCNMFCLVYNWKAYGWAENLLFLLYLSCVVTVFVCVFCSYWPFLFQGGLSYLSLFSYKFSLCVLALVMFQMLHLFSMEYNIDITLGALSVIYISSFSF